jgi:hypothetical protein
MITRITIVIDTITPIEKIGHPNRNGCCSCGEPGAVPTQVAQPHPQRVRGDGRVPPGQRQRGGREHRLLPGVAAVAELVGFLQPSLADPQRRQPDQAPAVQAGTGAEGDPQAGVEFPLGLRPAAAGGEQASVEDAALGVQERAAVGRDEVVGDAAPLRRPVEVGGQLARGEHVAADVHDGVEHGRPRRPGRP